MKVMENTEELIHVLNQSLTATEIENKKERNPKFCLHSWKVPIEG